MTGIAADQLLEPVTPDAPAGPDLEYDPTYRAAFDAAQGTPERQIGSTVVSGEEPDWHRVQGLASDLLTHSKDLRVAVLLTRALARVQGLDGLESGLALIQGLMERYWDQVYPQLDPEDDYDPTARVNCLLDLCDRALLLDALRDTPLVRSRVFGPVTYRAIEIAEGRTSAPADGKALDAAAISGAFQECDGDELKSTAVAVAGALDRARSILDGLGARIRSDQMPDFDPLTGLLAAIERALQPHLAQRGRSGLRARRPGQRDGGSHRGYRTRGSPAPLTPGVSAGPSSTRVIGSTPAPPMGVRSSGSPRCRTPEHPCRSRRQRPRPIPHLQTPGAHRDAARGGFRPPGRAS